MRFWFDTEFYEDARTIQLISIGIVAEDGSYYYAETKDARSLANRTQWLAENVAPHLDSIFTKERWHIAEDIVDFVGENPEFWAYYANYDWVVLCKLFGRMVDLPEGWPMYCRDVKQFADSLGNPELPKQTTTKHHALADARWTREAWQFLSSRAEC